MQTFTQDPTIKTASLPHTFLNRMLLNKLNICKYDVLKSIQYVYRVISFHLQYLAKRAN